MDSPHLFFLGLFLAALCPVSHLSIQEFTSYLVSWLRLWTLKNALFGDAWEPASDTRSAAPEEHLGI